MRATVQRNSALIATCGAAIVGVAIGIAVGAGFGSDWWRAPAAPIASAQAPAGDAARDLLRRIDAARGTAALDPTIARLLRDTALELNAQAARGAALTARVGALERTAGPANAALARTAANAGQSAPDGGDTGAPDGTTAGTDRQRQYQRLIAAGASATDARALLAFVDEIALQEAETRFRLYRASHATNTPTRAGGHESPIVLMQELRRLGDVQGQLRDTFGDEALDRYLYAQGLPNRLRVSAVLAGSVAERAGLMPGDVLLSYDGQVVHSVDDVLRQAASGSEGDSVEVVALRGTDRQQLSVPRGALGFRGESVSVNPALGSH